MKVRMSGATPTDFDFWKKIPLGIVLFLFFFSIYSLTLSGAITFGDEIEKYKVAQSIVEHQDFAIRRTAVRYVAGQDGRIYSIYELGQIVAEIPFYVLGKLFAPLAGMPDPNSIPMLFVGWMNPLVSALTGVIFFKFCQRLGYSPGNSLGLTLVFGLTTIVLPYAHGFTREPLLTFFLLGWFYAAIRFGERGAARWLVTAAVVFGLLVVTKFIHMVLAPAFFGYVVWILFKTVRSSQDPRARVALIVKTGAVVLLPVAAFLVVQGIYNWSRFGSPLSGLAGGTADPLSIYGNLASRGNLLAGVTGLLFSPAKSIFIYSPPALLLLPSIVLFYRQRKADAIFLVAILLTVFFVTAARVDWDGGSWWGPRYLVQLTPLLILPIGLLIESRAAPLRFWKYALFLLALLGLGVQWVGALVSNRDYLDIVNQIPQLAGQFDFLRHGALDSLLLSLSPDGFPLRLNPFGVVLIAIIVFLSGLIAIRSPGDAPSRSSSRLGFVFLASVLILQLAAFLAFVVVPYPHVLTAKADTHFAAANIFRADGRECQARALYFFALERGTRYQSAALARLRESAPRPQSEALLPAVLLNNVELSADASASIDPAVTLEGAGALKITAVAGGDVIARAVSDPIAVSPNENYEVSGWFRTENVYGAGYAVVAVYEDDGNWGKGRDTDIAGMDETSGWRLFQKSFRTLATTRRLFVSAGLWKTEGTVWLEGLAIEKIGASAPTTLRARVPCQ